MTYNGQPYKPSPLKPEGMSRRRLLTSAAAIAAATSGWLYHEPKFKKLSLKIPLVAVASKGTRIDSLYVDPGYLDKEEEIVPVSSNVSEKRGVTKILSDPFLSRHLVEDHLKESVREEESLFGPNARLYRINWGDDLAANYFDIEFDQDTHVEDLFGFGVERASNHLRIVNPHGSKVIGLIDDTENGKVDYVTYADERTDIRGFHSSHSRATLSRDLERIIALLESSTKIKAPETAHI